MKILFAEDNIDLLEVYEEEIRYSFPDCHLELAKNGQEALDLCEKVEFDLVFTDGKMPIVDGLELATTLKSKNFPGKVFMITGHFEKISKEKLVEVGIEEVFFKPFDMDKLIDLIKSFM